MTLTPLVVPLSEGRWTPGDHNLDGSTNVRHTGGVRSGRMGEHGYSVRCASTTFELRTTRTDYRRAQGFKSLSVNEPLALRADEQAGSYDSSVRLVPANAHLVSA